MQNRRKLKRRHLIYYLRVFDRSTDQLVEHLVDITAEGAMLMSEKQIETEATFELRMVLPDENNKNVHLEFEARSIWCNRDVNPDFFVTGFQLQNITSHDVETIERLIDEYGFRD